MTRRRNRSPLAPALAATVLLAACSGSGGGNAAKPSKDDLVAEVASFDLTTGPPSRILVGVLTADQRFVVFGTVRFRFGYLGTKEDAKPAQYGDPVTARFLAIPGLQVPDPAPTDPRIESGAEARGVYAAAAGFSQAGYYSVEVTAKVGGKERTAT